mgnify:CR=1 FL=1
MAMPKPCGTWAAYKRHIERYELPCDDCMEAMRWQSRRRRYQKTGLDKDIFQLVHILATAMGEGRRP